MHYMLALCFSCTSTGVQVLVLCSSCCSRHLNCCDDATGVSCVIHCPRVTVFSGCAHRIHLWDYDMFVSQQPGDQPHSPTAELVTRTKLTAMSFSHHSGQLLAVR